MAKKTYLTKADALSFARYCTSDERRGKLQREARAKYDQGIINFVPWVIAERIVTDQDFIDWKIKYNK